MKKETHFAHIGAPKAGLGTAVNPSISRASTLLFDRAEDLYRSDVRGYGRHGTEIHDALIEAFNDLEDGAGTVLCSSGLAACTFAILSQVKSGDHILLTDSSYGPTRYFCHGHLKKMGIETEMYDPRIGADISTLIRKNTSLILLESPGSLSFEIQDIPAICKVAKANDVVTIIDNTWSAGLSFNPLKLGVDISCHAATKYFGGHSDIMYGAIISRTKTKHDEVKLTAKHLGNATSPDDTYQILRGFRTLVTRFQQQEYSSLTLANWLAKHDRITQVLHPAHPTHPDYDLWKRDFTGGGCIFSVIFKPCSNEDVIKFVNALKIFGIGFSYGGFESLCIHCDPQLKRQHAEKLNGPLVRFSCGLENVEDLKSDIEQAFNEVF